LHWRSASLRRVNAADRLIGDQIIGYSNHYQGNQSSAWRHLARDITNDDAPTNSGSRIVRFHFDQ
jgi:hypothetical protein